MIPVGQRECATQNRDTAMFAANAHSNCHPGYHKGNETHVPKQALTQELLIGKTRLI